MDPLKLKELDIIPGTSQESMIFVIHNSQTQKELLYAIFLVLITNAKLEIVVFRDQHQVQLPLLSALHLECNSWIF